MTRLITKILTTAALVSAVSFTAFAGPEQGWSGQASPMLDKMDANKDGLIQLAEFTAHGDQSFAQMDADGNGLVTEAEKTAFRSEMRALRTENRFDKIDTNSDGNLSKTEFMAAQELRQERVMERRDINGDGVFNKGDKEARRQKMKQHRKEFKTMRKERGSRVKPDANGDGMIDLAEHQNAMQARFTRMDKNGDGVLGADEQRRPSGRRGMHRH